MISVATALKPTLIPTAELDLIWFWPGVILGDRGKEAILEYTGSGLESAWVDPPKDRQVVCSAQ